MKIGERVHIIDPKHPWVDYGGVVVSGEETYGLGWKGYRVRLDETCGHETYVTPKQVMQLPTRGDAMRATPRPRCY